MIYITLIASLNESRIIIYKVRHTHLIYQYNRSDKSGVKI